MVNGICHNLIVKITVVLEKGQIIKSAKINNI
jgi:hypothetical protein